MSNPKAERSFFLKHHDLEVILGNHNVKLLGSGNERKARCPFHEDKNPSFSVNLQEGSWKCFAGCGGGGVIEFLSKKLSRDSESIVSDFYHLHHNGKSHAAPALPLDWKACVESFTEAHLQKLCKWRGYSEKFVRHLLDHKLIGICEGNLALPIYAAGRVIGTHQRLSTGGWLIRGGSGSPWVIGDHFETVLLFESQWDAFALMDAMGWFDTPAFSASCSIVITRGAAKGKAIQNLFPTSGKIIVWMQNDEPDANGNVAADKWLSDVLSVVRRANICRPPKEHKDLNDWIKAGATGTNLIDLMDSSEPYRDPNLPAIPSPLNPDRLMKFDPRNDPDCLLGNRYLCRGGSAIVVGGSGIGKSVIALQSAITFALGQDLFGLKPKRPLTSIIISAEDDDGDIAEIYQGVLEGMEIKEGSEHYQLVKDRVRIFPESVLKGLPFIGYCEELITEYGADLLWINPVLSFFSGNPSDPEKTSEFTGALSSMQVRTKVCSMLIHHTGKPKESKTTDSWTADDFSYIGLGSSIWTNWARAILVLQAIKSESGVFVLRFAKRGNRSGIINDDLQKIREIYIQHSKTGLRWMPSEYFPESSEKKKMGRPPKSLWNKVNDGWDGSPKSILEIKAIFMDFLDISKSTAYDLLEKWSGIYITKNTNDLWIKLEQDSGKSGKSGK